MKAISIRQPWASLIAHGIKDIENRTWKCPKKYIGQMVLIHASANDGFGRIVNEEAIFKLYIQRFGIECKKLPHGAIIGSVVIAGCVKNHPSVWAEKGCWNWVLKDVVLFDKIIENVKCKHGFWEYKNLEIT